MSPNPDDVLREVFDTYATPTTSEAIADVDAFLRAFEVDELADLLDRAAARASQTAHYRATKQRAAVYTYGSGTETDPSHMLLTTPRDLADDWLALLVEHKEQVEVGWPQTFVTNLYTRSQQQGGWAFTGRELVHLKMLVNKLYLKERPLLASLEPTP